MRPKVIITKKIPKEIENYIGLHCDYDIWNEREIISKEKLLENLKDVKGILTDGILIDNELLSCAPQLKVVSNMSVGYDNLDIKALKKNNIYATHTPGVLNNTVADLVLGLMLSVSRRINELDSFIRSGHWKLSNNQDNSLLGIDIHNKKLGIIGLGRVGLAVAQRAKKGFNMEVSYYNRNRNKEAEDSLQLSYDSLNNLIKKSDYLVLLTPLTKETYHLIGKKEFKLMKRNAIFINASRGQVVNEFELINALQKSEIFGAGLDVFDREPIHFDNPLLQMDNVVLTPHIGSATAETRYKMAELAAKNLINGLLKNEYPYLIKELKK